MHGLDDEPRVGGEVGLRGAEKPVEDAARPQQAGEPRREPLPRGSIEEIEQIPAEDAVDG